MGLLTFNVVKKKDLNKMRMYDQVVQIITENGAVWQANVPFSESYATFSEKLEGLKAYIGSQHVLKGTHAVHKREAQEALIEVALRIEQLMVFFAAKSENAVLLNDVKHTFSFWKRASESNRLLQGEHLLALVEEHLPDLGDYGLSQADVDELTEKINVYALSIGEPRTAIVHRVHLTEGISEIINELDELLKLQLDTFVRSLVLAQPDFVSLYLHAREIIHYKGKGKTGPEKGKGGENE